MYYNGQIVWDIDGKRPVQVGDGDSLWAWDGIPPNTTHFLEKNPKHTLVITPPKHANGLPMLLSIDGHLYRYSDYVREQEYSIALPDTIEEATALMDKGLIFPAPVSRK